MFPLEKQVCSREVGKKLDDLGFKFYSYFKYVHRVSMMKDEWVLWNPTEVSEFSTGFEIEYISAFTDSEIEYKLNSMKYADFGLFPNKKGYCCYTGQTFVSFAKIPFHRAFGETPVEARIYMLIWLLENNYITF